MGSARLQIIHGDLSKELGSLELRLDQFLLISHAAAVARLRGLLHLLEQLGIAFEDGALFGQEANPKILGFHLREDLASNRLITLLRGFRVLFGNFAFQPQLSGERKVLGETQPDVSEIAVRVSGKGARAADAELLHHDFGVRERGDLRRDFARRVPAVARGLDLRIVAFGLSQQIGELRRLAGRRRLLRLSRIRPREERSDRQNPYRREFHTLSFLCPGLVPALRSMARAGSVANPAHKKTRALS